jgi:hypothetical protein
MRRVVVALVLGLRIAGDEGSVHHVLMIIIVRERGMDLRRREVGILLDDLRRTVAIRDVIGDEVDDPMAGPSRYGTPRAFRVMWG